MSERPHGDMERRLEELAKDLAAARAQQAASAHVLRVISDSGANTQPVFASIVESCAQLFQDSAVTLWLARDGVLRAKERGGKRAGGTRLPDEIPFARGNVPSRCMLEGTIIYVEDMAQALPQWGEPMRLSIEQGYRSMVGAPLMSEGVALGCISVLRTTPAAFAESELDLLGVFADQAVIAIQNARLFSEIQEWNRKLQTRVAEGIAELERMSRLKRFLSPQLAEAVISGGGEDLLKHHRREIVVVFLDLRGFTAFTETADPEEVMNILNEYYGAMGTLVHAHAGTLASYAGDGMMALFNDPIPIPDAPARAAAMAVEMQRTFRPLCDAWRSRGYDLTLGIGIAQGYATLGTIGFEGRRDYGAIGTVCNLASRLCGEASGGEILVSQRVLAAIKGKFPTDPCGELALKGFHKPVPAYRIVTA